MLSLVFVLLVLSTVLKGVAQSTLRSTCGSTLAHRQDFNGIVGELLPGSLGAALATNVRQ